MVGDMDDKEIIYDHYKDTFELQKCYLAKRDKITVLLLVLCILLIGLIFDPNYISEKVNYVLNSQIENLVFDLQFINTGIILIMLWYTLQYYLVVLQIEKMYNYLNECEKKLSDLMESATINREGAYYLKSYPWLKDLADIFFVIGVPAGIITLSIFKILNEWQWTSYIRIVDISLLAILVLFSIMYLSNRKLREEYFDKTVYPSLKWYQRLIGYLRIKSYQSEENNG